MAKASIALGLIFISLFQSSSLWAAVHAKDVAKPSSLRNISELEIDRIDFKGVFLFDSERMQKLLEISPGDRLERSKVLKTEENIQALYRLRGYREARIQSRLLREKAANQTFETVLEFQVQEGLPVRIAKINLISDTAIDDSNQRSWEWNKDKIKTKLGLNFGDPLDQEKISDGSKLIHELLASESYVGAKVTDVREVTTAPPKTKEGQSKAGAAARWVNLEFHIDLGDRVSFGFQGNSVFTYPFLMSLVDEQRLLGLGKDYVGAIRTRLEEEYRASGYPLATITPFTFEGKNQTGRRVTYYIKEGPRVAIESVEFDGNSVFSSAELRTQFFAKASGLVQRKVYVDKDVQKAAEILVDWLKERGYLSARLVTINTRYTDKSKANNENKSVRLLIYLYEGDQTQIQSISITGAKVLSNEEIKNLLRLKEGAALNLFAMAEGIEKLKKIYQEKGYLSFRILNEGTDNLAVYSQENRLVDINFNLEEGNQYKVKRIDIEGLEKTKDYVLLRELSFKVGDIVSFSQLGKTERKLRKLGIFSSVTFKVLDEPAAVPASLGSTSSGSSNGGKIIKIIVQEADRGVISGGPGYRNDLGIRAFGQMAYTNLWGEDHTASINLAINRRFHNYNFLEGQAQIAYSWPWFLLPEMYFRPFISFGSVQYMTVIGGVQAVSFAARTLTVAGSWQKQLMAVPNLVTEFGYSFESISQFLSATKGDDQQMTIGSVSQKLTLDLRDSALTPTSGFFGMASLDYAAPFLGSRSDIGYYRAQLRTDFYFPLLSSVSLYMSFRTGFEKTLAPLPSGASTTDSIPLIKQFTMGGIGSIRGYQLQELSFQGVLRGSNLSYVNYRSELNLPFAGALKLALFFDAGNLMVDNYSFGSLKCGAGFGLHYMTPVGPVSFDYGIKIAPEAKTESSAVYFSVGVI